MVKNLAQARKTLILSKICWNCLKIMLRQNSRRVVCGCCFSRSIENFDPKVPRK